ncbi:hypothetical protein [Pseudorhodoferax sp. Leaf267]|uniref:hypothetical protein n=1 Tax=Pseudorhodoferax sp. Leaf267 TaxID=1736316 RepID=UPI0006F96A95|nr:hypothetical protein [Pseudorhodoferax sp. Leaf267]KQP13568.1 hypothetical protein ASF43_16770 [Pseudorhodoferax sp. Leaf267]
MTPETEWSAAALQALAAQAATPPCDSCRTLPSGGWEAMPSSLDRARLEPVGTLYPAAATDLAGATLDEYHPNGTRYWSADAPIALGWFPYNRCSVWRCRVCATVFVRYAETGGYFEEERIRRVDPALVVATPGKT